MDSVRRPETNVRIAGIDIGTNTLLLLIADVGEDGSITPIHHQQRLPRIGRQVDGNRIIRPEAIAQTVSILNEYCAICRHFNTDYITAAATSAVRDAANRDEFLKSIRTSTGLDVDVVSGEEEGALTYEGVLTDVLLHAAGGLVVLDVGGGSTEVISGRPDERTATVSVRSQTCRIGAVRLAERFFRHDPPAGEEITAATIEVDSIFRDLEDPCPSGSQLIAVAGTATTLACFDQGLQEFDLRKVHGYRLDADRVEDWTQRLLSLRSSRILELSRSAAGREDILSAGSLILHRFMKRYGFNAVIVSERGLRYGLVLKEWRRVRK